MGILLFIFFIWILYKAYQSLNIDDSYEKPYRRTYSDKKDYYSNGSSLEVAKEKGDTFEAFAAKKFSSENFIIKDWKSDKFVDGIYAESNKHPDLEIEFLYKNNSYIFAVECKFRSRLPESNIIDIDERKLNNYKKYETDKNISVYILLGIGGQATCPERLFLIPLNKMNSSIITNEMLEKYWRPTNKRFYYNIFSKSLS